MIRETWAERHILDITKKQCCHTRPVKARLARLHGLELMRRRIRRSHSNPDAQLAALANLREILERL